MAKTDLDICNAALSLLGAAAIISFDDGTTESDNCLIHFQRVLDAALSMRDWSFALKSARLAKINIDPVSDWDTAFALPTDCLFVRSISGRGSALGKDYAIVGDEIHCNQDSVVLRYIHRVEPSQLPAYFEKYVVYSLAKEIAYVITGSNTMVANQRAMADEQLVLAKNADASSQSLRVMPQSTLVQRRKAGI